jgi:hypothetical protein
MIPHNRVQRALLNVEKQGVLEDILQLEAAIVHLKAEGKHNYDVAKKSNDRYEDYGDTSDKILADLEARLQERKSQLDALIDELALLEE